MKIDRQYIVIKRELFGFQLNFDKPTPTSLLCRIDFAKRGTDIQVTPWLKLIVKDFYFVKFNFDRHINLTDDERQWLAEKLSSWLEIPINEYPQHDDIDLNHWHVK